MMLVVGLCLHAFRFYVDASTSQLFITGLGFILGSALYGPIAIFGVMASEAAPSHLSGTSHAIVALAANGNSIDFYTNQMILNMFCIQQLVPSFLVSHSVCWHSSTVGRQSFSFSKWSPPPP